ARTLSGPTRSRRASSGTVRPAAGGGAVGVSGTGRPPGLLLLELERALTLSFPPQERLYATGGASQIGPHLFFRLAQLLAFRPHALSGAATGLVRRRDFSKRKGNSGKH